MKPFSARSLCLCVLFLCSVLAFGQTTPSTSTATTSAFPSTTVTFNLDPIALPGGKTALTGAETDILLPPTTNNQVGETTLISSGYTFIGGRYNRLFPSVSKWLNNISPALNGYEFQFGLTGSVGVVDIPGAAVSKHWGERAGGFVNYAINGTFGLGAEAQWDNMPGYAHNTYSVAFGPNFHF